MKRFILPLIALTFLVGACSSPTQPTAQKPSGPPKLTGTRTTAWGDLPTYEQTGHTFKYAKLVHPGLTPKNPVILDVVVDANGAVQDATVTTSSGNASIDRAALASFIGARYSLQVGPDYPAPFVVQQTIDFRRELAERPSWSQLNPGPQNQGPSLPPANSSYYQDSPFGTGNSSSSSSSSN